jgi:hypothetical protein
VLAGFVLSKFGVGWVFTLNAGSFLTIIYALVGWKRQPSHSTMPSEELVTAVKAGYRYLLYSPPLKNLVLRTGLFMLFASAFWGLFPSLARFHFNATATGFGILYGFLGVGAVFGATAMPLLAEKISVDKRIALTTCLYALGTLMLILFKPFVLLYLAMCIIGFAWIVTVSTFNFYVQSTVAGWVKARAIGVYVMGFQGALALGSVLWGTVASHTTLSSAFGISSAGLALTAITAAVWPLNTGKELNMEYSFHWPQPADMPDIDHERGPVLISIAYEVEPKHHDGFLKAIGNLRDMRLRDGAIQWGIFRDTEDENMFIENFTVESWGEHLRQHTRPTIADKELEDAVFKFNKGGAVPSTKHYIAEACS